LLNLCPYHCLVTRYRKYNIVLQTKLLNFFFKINLTQLTSKYSILPIQTQLLLRNQLITIQFFFKLNLTQLKFCHSILTTQTQQIKTNHLYQSTSYSQVKLSNLKLNNSNISTQFQQFKLNIPNLTIRIQSRKFND
jgi:hypothetical protein